MNDSILRIRRMFLIPLAVLALFDVALIIVLATRLTATTVARQHERDDLAHEKTTLEQKLKPFQDIDKKLPASKKDVEEFYKNRFPDYYSRLSDELNKLGQQEGIQLSSITYANTDANEGNLRSTHPTGAVDTTPGVQPIRVSTGITGDYTKIVKFINALEREQSVFFIVEKLGLSSQSSNQPGQGSGTVSLQISLLTFMRKV